MRHVITLLAILAVSIVVNAIERPVVATRQGLLRGVAGEDSAAVTIYKGVPFAAPPVGALRWKAPQPPIPWDGIRDADKWGPAAIQPEWLPATEPVDEYHVDYYREFYPQGSPMRSEDCLYLNIWTPAAAAPGDSLPVALWIHGGGFNHGWAYEKEFDGEEMARQGVIMVSANYRLGPLGFLAHPALSADDPRGVSGNYGLLDQQAALQWIQDNIAAFGGNPDNVTLFGQSAGGMSVKAQLASPGAATLFNKAIIQSAGGLREGDIALDLKQMEAIGEEIFPGMSVDELKALSSDEVVKRYNAWRATHGDDMPMRPVVDGEVLPLSWTQAALEGTLNPVPIMIGYTTEDIERFTHGDDYVALQETLVAQGHPEPYLYIFGRDLPGDKAGAFHSSELWYVFGTLGRSWRPMTEHDYKLSEQMNSHWTRFMKSGQPADSTSFTVFR